MNVSTYLGQLAALNQVGLLGVQGVNTMGGTDAWDQTFADSGWQLNVVPLTTLIKDRLASPWTESCFDYVGVTVQDNVGDVQHGCTIQHELRCAEQNYYVPLSKTDSEAHQFQVMFAFDNRGITRFEAGLSIIQTVFICFCVALGALSFSKDANELLLKPVERMIAKMETIKDNPFEAMRLGDQEYRREEIEHAKRKARLTNLGRFWKTIYTFRSMRKKKEPMETVMLERTIIKLGALLALGFGEAGAEIVGQNMASNAFAFVNPALPGAKVEAIIGLCKIRNFLEATEVLKEKVMLFVNQVGEIVHGCIDDYHGAPNKNIGDSFLVVWRLSGREFDQYAKVADMAMLSFLRITAEVNKSRVLAAYRTHPGLLQRMPRFRVQLGFGLHSGWVIEGAIGSDFKIDPSYLSPNVHVSSQLESATKHYGVSMLFSQEVINLCSEEAALRCRQIDKVCVQGAKKPMRIYTIDLDIQPLEVQNGGRDKIIKNLFKIRQLREIRKSEKWSEDFYVWEAFTSDLDIKRMRARYSAEFFQRFATAMRNYEVGQWLAARDMFLTCHYQPKDNLGAWPVQMQQDWPEDAPTVTLLKFMERTSFEPPVEWAGHRELPT